MYQNHSSHRYKYSQYRLKSCGWDKHSPNIVFRHSLLRKISIGRSQYRQHKLVSKAHRSLNRRGLNRNNHRCICIDWKLQLPLDQYKLYSQLVSFLYRLHKNRDKLNKILDLLLMDKNRRHINNFHCLNGCQMLHTLYMLNYLQLYTLYSRCGIGCKLGDRLLILSILSHISNYLNRRGNLALHKSGKKMIHLLSKLHSLRGKLSRLGGLRLMHRTHRRIHSCLNRDGNQKDCILSKLSFLLLYRSNSHHDTEYKLQDRLQIPNIHTHNFHYLNEY